MLSASQYTALRALVNCPGPTGADGTDGSNGTNGPTGPKGETGPIGATGSQGLQGIGSNTTQSFSVRGITSSPWFQTSIDGTTWVNTPSVSFSAPTDIAWNGTIWVAGTLSTTSQFAYSTDGTNWNALAVTPFGTASGAGPRAIVWNEKLWIAVGDPGSSPTSTSVTVAYSYDGLTWTGVASSYSTVLKNGYDIAWNGRVFVAVGTPVSGTNAVAVSQNGTSWTPIAVSATGITSGRTVGWSGQRWVVGGASTTSTDSKIVYSNIFDASSGWINASWSGNPFNNECRSIAWNGSMWVAIGGTPSGSYLTTLATSSSGTSWTPVLTNATTPSLTNGQSVMWNGLYWVATGDNTEELVYSANGTNWTTISTTLGGSTITSRAIPNDTYPVPYINIRDLGAFGDGVTDDINAINTAISIASRYPNGAKVVVPAGTYLSSTTTINIPTTINFVLEQGASIVTNSSGTLVTIQFSDAAGGNAVFETRRGELSAISDYKGRVLTGALRAGQSPGVFGSDDGVDSTMVDIRYDNAFVTSTSATINISGWAGSTFTVSLSRTFRKNQAITFNSAIASNIVVGTVYYIFATVTGTTFQITSIPNGTAFGLTGTTASGTAILYEGDGTLRGLNVRDVLNNSSNVAGGNRVAVNGRIQQQQSTSSGALGSRYIGVGGYVTTTSGDSGTALTATNARGSYIGGNFYGSATTSGSTNILTVTGVESAAEVGASSTATHIIGVASVGSVNATSAASASANAAYTIGGATGSSGQSHGGWSTGILFTNLHGQDPLNTSSKLIASYWNSGATTRPITDGIDLSGFDISGSVLKSKNITMSDTTSSIQVINTSGVTGTTSLTSKALTLGSDSTTGKTLVSTSAQNTTLQLQGLGTVSGGVEILDQANTARLTVKAADSGAVVVNPVSGALGTTTLSGTTVAITGVTSTTGTTTLGNDTLTLGALSNISSLRAGSGTELRIRPNTGGAVRITNAAATSNRIETTDTDVTLNSGTGNITLQNNGSTVATVRSTGITTSGLTATGTVVTTGTVQLKNTAGTSNRIETTDTAVNITSAPTGRVAITGGDLSGGLRLFTSSGSNGTIEFAPGGNPASVIMGSTGLTASNGINTTGLTATTSIISRASGSGVFGGAYSYRLGGVTNLVAENVVTTTSAGPAGTNISTTSISNSGFSGKQITHVTTIGPTVTSLVYNFLSFYDSVASGVFVFKMQDNRAGGGPTDRRGAIHFVKSGGAAMLGTAYKSSITDIVLTTGNGDITVTLPTIAGVTSGTAYGTFYLTTSSTLDQMFVYS